MSDTTVPGQALDEQNTGLVFCLSDNSSKHFSSYVKYRSKRAPPALPPRLQLETPTTSCGFTETLRLSPSEENFRQQNSAVKSGSSRTVGSSHFSFRSYRLFLKLKNRVLENLFDAQFSMEKSLANLAKYRNSEFLNLTKFNKNDDFLPRCSIRCSKFF